MGDLVSSYLKSWSSYWCLALGGYILSWTAWPAGDVQFLASVALRLRNYMHQLLVLCFGLSIPDGNSNLSLDQNCRCSPIHKGMTLSPSLHLVSSFRKVASDKPCSDVADTDSDTERFTIKCLTCELVSTQIARVQQGNQEVTHLKVWWNNQWKRRPCSKLCSTSQMQKMLTLIRDMTQKHQLCCDTSVFQK